MVTVLVTQTVNWVKLYSILTLGFVCFVYGGIFDTINRLCTWLSPPLMPRCGFTGVFFCVFALP